ncbi:MAG: HPr family phosphocarrier protein [Leptospiraceae bacterium]|nr:HPr family phosphocarrier protein [Leptospiraceae bacterium]MDW7976100.1 HPr family phosphocarrier protein [Leptospiraceae bacterium]
MIVKTLKVNLESGLHARPAAEFVRVASKFRSSVIVEYEGISVNGKSIMGLLMLGLHPGAEIKVIINGDDEKEAFQSIQKLLKSG